MKTPFWAANEAYNPSFVTHAGGSYVRVASGIMARHEARRGNKTKRLLQTHSERS
jgi:hypothetical protein